MSTPSPSIGGPGGQPFAFSCPTGTYVTQVDGRSGSWLDGISVTCSDGTKSSYYGGQGGAAWSEPSAGGFTSLGSSSGGVFVDGLQFQRPDGSFSPLRGGRGTTGSKQIVWPGCPQGQVINSVSGRSATYLDQLQVGCGNIAAAVKTAVASVAPTLVATPPPATPTPDINVITPLPNPGVQQSPQPSQQPDQTNWLVILLFVLFVFMALFLVKKMMPSSVSGGYDDDFN